jgi:hypothetical protein
MHSRVASSTVAAAPVVTVETVTSNASESALGSRLTTELMDKLRVDDRVQTRTSSLVGDDAAQGNDYVLRTAISTVDGKPVATATLFNARTGITLHQVEVDASTPSDSVARAIVVSMRKALGRDIEHAELARRIKNRTALSQINASYHQQMEADSLRKHKAFMAAEVALQQADSMLVIVPHSSSTDVDVLNARAAVASDLMWVHFMSRGPDTREARQAMARGLAFAEEAAQKQPANAKALEAAGMFSHFLSATTPADSFEARAPMRETSIRYLNAAVKADPARANAWSVLSVGLMDKGDYPRAYTAAKQGRLQDVFQEKSTELDGRMFDAALQNGDTAAARAACHDFQNDYGTGFYSAACQMQLLAWNPYRMPGDDNLINRLVNVKERTSPAQRMYLRMQAATYYARQGQPARARAYALNSAATIASKDTELLRVTAWYYLVSGDTANAQALVGRITQVSPSIGDHVARSVEFASLRRGEASDRAKKSTVD